MSNSSILGGTSAPRQSEGKDVDHLGPSDSSDSGSDVQGERSMPTAPDNPGEWGAVVADMDSDTDSAGTGERASADGSASQDGADILPDHIIDGIGAEGDVSGRGKSVGAAAAELSTEDDEEDAERDDEIESAP